MSATTTLIGNAVNDIELRYSQNGKPVAKVTIAVSDRKFDRQSNEWVDGDTWFARCTIFGDMAEHAAGSILKGTRVIAEGKIQQRDYEDRDGNKRTSVEVLIDEIGPSLRYATASVTKASRGQGSQVQSDAWPAAQVGQQSSDPWSTPGGFSDDSPF
jgi:single-strand DNA-binding protein